jgi:hypothetical protein
MIHLATLGVGFFAMAGPVLALMAVLNSRDRKEDRLYARILGELNTVDLRGLYSVRVACRTLGLDTVFIDLWNCPPQRAWEVMMRISARLPRRVRLEVSGITDSRSASSLSLTVSKRFPLMPGCAACS